MGNNAKTGAQATSAARKAKYTNYRNRGMAKFNQARALRRHLRTNPNDALATSVLEGLRKEGFAK